MKVDIERSNIWIEYHRLTVFYYYETTHPQAYIDGVRTLSKNKFWHKNHIKYNYEENDNE